MKLGPASDSEELLRGSQRFFCGEFLSRYAFNE